MNVSIAVIDMQKCYLYGNGDGCLAEYRHPPHDESERIRIIGNIKTLLASAVDKAIPITFVEFRGHSSTIDELLEVVPAGHPSPGGHRIIGKNSDDAFDSSITPNLPASLKAAGIDTLVVSGVKMSYCVLETATSALERGLSVISAPDLMSDFDVAGAKELSLRWFARNTQHYPNHRTLIEALPSYEIRKPGCVASMPSQVLR